jgi:hypothetical protein
VHLGNATQCEELLLCLHDQICVAQQDNQFSCIRRFKDCLQENWFSCHTSCRLSHKLSLVTQVVACHTSCRLSHKLSLVTHYIRGLRVRPILEAILILSPNLNFGHTLKNGPFTRNMDSIVRCRTTRLFVRRRTTYIMRSHDVARHNFGCAASYDLHKFVFRARSSLCM